MADINNVTLTGMLSADCEYKQTSGGKSLVEFRMTSFRRTKGADGRSDVDFFTVTLWGKAADALRDYLKKGQRVGIVGRVEMQQWDDRETGKKRTTYKIIANDVSLMGGGKNNGNGSNGGSSNGGSQDDAPMVDENGIPF